MGQICDGVVDVQALTVADGTTDFGTTVGNLQAKVFTFSVSLNTSVKLYIRTNGVSSVLNADVALAANSMYSFTVILRPRSTYTFRVSAACTVNELYGVMSME